MNIRGVATFVSVMIFAGATVANAQEKDPFGERTPLAKDRGYDKDQPRTRAINAAGRPGYIKVSEEELAKARAQEAEHQEQKAAYAAAVADWERQVAEGKARHAEVMKEWEKRVADCKSGIRSACMAPES